MKNGNWVPISKALVKDLPSDRAYTRLEAAFSIQCDYDVNKQVTVAGYADLWRWSRNRVRNFLEMIRVDIVYVENTEKRQNQKGQIAIQIKDRYGTDKGQIRLIDNKGLEVSKDRYGTDKGQIKDRSRATTRDTNTKTKKEPKPFGDDFNAFWLAYPKKKSKGQAVKTYEKLKRTNRLPSGDILIAAIDKLKLTHDWQKDNGQFIPHPSSWLNDMGWEDEVYKEPATKKLMRDGREVPDTPMI